MLERLRQIAIDVGLDPDEALEMTVLDFMRVVSERRAKRMGPFHHLKPDESRSEWLRKVETHCNNARRSSLATMSALGKSSSKVRKAVAS